MKSFEQYVMEAKERQAEREEKEEREEKMRLHLKRMSILRGEVE